jgi:hypothetical protein
MFSKPPTAKEFIALFLGIGAGVLALNLVLILLHFKPIFG